MFKQLKSTVKVIRTSGICIGICIFFVISPVLAQNNLETLTADDFLKLSIPSLDILFENAKNSAAVDFYNVKMEEEASALKTEKRSWMKYFKLASSYQWGLMGVNTSFSDNDTPLFYQYSGARQSWYNVGVQLSIPLDDLLDKANRIDRQKLKTKATKVEMEKWHDEQKLRIIEVYTAAIKELAVLKLKAEALAFANAQYMEGERDFLNGRITSVELSVIKSRQMNSLETYENTKAELSKALLKLEVLSQTKIINR